MDVIGIILALAAVITAWLIRRRLREQARIRRADEHTTAAMAARLERAHEIETVRQ